MLFMLLKMQRLLEEPTREEWDLARSHVSTAPQTAPVKEVKTKTLSFLRGRFHKLKQFHSKGSHCEVETKNLLFRFE